jgi:aminoglycoside phosphotransferase (APT) family kinase protein
MIMDKMGTGNLETRLAQHPSESHHYVRSAGEFLATLHRIQLPGFGSLSLLQAQNGALAGVAHSWKEAVRARLGETTEYLVAHGIINGETEIAVRDTLDREEHLLDLTMGTLLHGDYHDANILIDEGTRSIAGAIDLSQPKVGDPLFDVAFYATYCQQEKRDYFLEGYFSSCTPPRDWQRKVALYQMRIYLSKAKLRKRFGYESRIPAAVAGLHKSMEFLTLT